MDAQEARHTLVAGTVAAIFLAGLWWAGDTARAEVMAVDFINHGTAAEVINPRGIVVARTEEGQNQILVWTSSTGGASLLVIDADTGDTEQFWPKTGGGGAPFSVLLTAAGHYYTYTDSHLMAYDINAGDWLAVVPGPGSFGMAFAEADDGTVYTGLYPGNHLVAFDPETRELTVHGPLYESESSQYPRQMAVDEAGWVYVGVTRSPNNLIAYHPQTREIRPLVGKDDLVGTDAVRLFRGVDGAVYGRANPASPWLRLLAGEADTLAEAPAVAAKPVITGSQGLVYRQFPDGSLLKDINLSERHATVIPAPDDLARTGTGQTWEPASRGSSARRAVDGDPDTYAAVPSGLEHSSDLPKDIGVEWDTPVTLQQVMVAFHSSGYQPTEDGHQLQAWKDGEWKSLEAEVTVKDEVYWDYRLSEPVETRRVRVLVTKFARYRTAVRMFRVFPDHRPDRDILRSEEGVTRITFDYTSEGVFIHSLVLGPDGRIYGSTGHPLVFFAYDPRTKDIDSVQLRGGHFNALTVQQGHIFAALYSGGTLHRFDPGQPRDSGGGNPAVVDSAGTDEAMITRPYGLYAHPDGRSVIMNGFYDWRDTAGGGLLIYDAVDKSSIKLSKHDLLVGHSTRALVALPNGDLVGATTVSTRGRVEPKADEAKLYILDWDEKRIIHQQVPFAGLGSINDMILGPDEDNIYGFAEGNLFFVFDPEARQVIHRETLDGYGVTAGGQAIRMMQLGPDGMIYALFRGNIVQIDPRTYAHRAIGSPPKSIAVGIVIHEGRIYFTHLGELWSAALGGLE